MPSTAAEPAPTLRAYATAFVLLDAAETGVVAIRRLLGKAARRHTHAIVRRNEGEQCYFYLFDAAALLVRLLGKDEIEAAQADLRTLLDLHEGGRSPVAGEDEAPVAGTVVVRGQEALGFVAADGVPIAPIGSSEALNEWRRPFKHDADVEAARARPDVRRHLDPGPSVRESSDNQVERHGSGGGGQSFEDAPDSLVPGGGLGFEFAPHSYTGVDYAEFSRRLAEAADDAPPGFTVRSNAPAGGPPKPLNKPPAQAGAPPLLPPTPPRYFNARTPERVALNAQTYVIVQVAIEAAVSGAGMAAGSGTLSVEFLGELTVDVHAPGLKANGPTTLTLQVPASGNSANVRFGFVAHKPGIHPVDVMAWNGSAQVAGLTLQIAVETAPQLQGANEAAADMDLREPETGEYTLDVAMQEESRRYCFQLRSDRKDVWPPMYSEPLLNERQRTYDAMVANLNVQARNLYGLNRDSQAVWLKGMGAPMFEQLVPDQLKSLLLQHKSRIRVLNIISAADPTPWELLFVSDPETGAGDFLAESTTVARWRYGAAPSRSLRHANNAVVLPKGAPPEAQAEVEQIKNLLGGAATVGELDGLNALLAAGGFDVLHFAAHNVNVPGAQGGAYVPFGTQRWDLTFMGAVPQNKFKSRAPLIFMNACTTSGTSALYTDLTGWADRFLRCGSGAFIGTLWEVRDGSARSFSLQVYAALKVGKTLGEAMHAARAALRAANPGDPTPLAYTLYGNPLARLETP